MDWLQRGAILWAYYSFATQETIGLLHEEGLDTDSAKYPKYIYARSALHMC